MKDRQGYFIVRPPAHNNGYAYSSSFNFHGERDTQRERERERVEQTTHRQELGEDFDGLGLATAVRHFLQRVSQLLGHSPRQQGARSHAHRALCPSQMSTDAQLAAYCQYTSDKASKYFKSEFNRDSAQSGFYCCSCVDLFQLLQMLQHDLNCSKCQFQIFRD